MADSSPLHVLCSIHLLIMCCWCLLISHERKDLMSDSVIALLFIKITRVIHSKNVRNARKEAGVKGFVNPRLSSYYYNGGWRGLNIFRYFRSQWFSTFSVDDQSSVGSLTAFIPVICIQCLNISNAKDLVSCKRCQGCTIL